MKILCVFGRHAYGTPSRGEGYEHANFLPALRALGHEVELFNSFDRAAYADFAELNLRLVGRIIAFRPDVVFCVLMHYEVWFDTLDVIRARTPALTVNWGTDNSWKFHQFSRFLARHVDLHVTTDATAAAAAARLGLTNVVSSQWAASSGRLAEPIPAADCSYDVSFVGAAYGNRRNLISALARRGVKVACFGHGWERGAIGSSEVGQIYRGSRISLNFADSGLQLAGGRIKRSRQIKARTFEVSGAGGMLLTEAADRLDSYLQPGREIVTFTGIDDLARKICHYLSQPLERDAIAREGHARVRRDHLYESRFGAVLAALHDARAARRQPKWLLATADLEKLVKRHRDAALLRRAAAASASLGRAVLGTDRASRAMRRLAFEASWRLCGESTYRAAGWPGRLFYGDS